MPDVLGPVNPSMVRVGGVTNENDVVCGGESSHSVGKIIRVIKHRVLKSVLCYPYRTETRLLQIPLSTILV